MSLNIAFQEAQAQGQEISMSKLNLLPCANSLNLGINSIFGFWDSIFLAQQGGYLSSCQFTFGMMMSWWA